MTTDPDRVGEGQPTKNKIWVPRDIDPVTRKEWLETIRNVNDAYLRTQESDRIGWFRRCSLIKAKCIFWWQYHHNICGDMMEIGVLWGKSAFPYACFLREHELLHCIDLFSVNRDPGGIRGHEIPSLQQFSKEAEQVIPHRCNNLYLRKMDSRRLHDCEEYKDKKFRFIHIDGNHGFEFARSDLRFAVQHIAVNGVIAIDDWMNREHEGVGQALMATFMEFDVCPILVDRDKIYLTLPSSYISEFFNQEA